MPIKNFDEILDRLKKLDKPKRIVVAAANDEHSLEAVFKAAADGFVVPVLVGNKAEISEILQKLNVSVPDEDIYDVSNPEAVAEKAVALIKEGKGDFLMKGKLETAQMLRPVVNKETGIGTGKLMSHFTMFEAPYYHKLFLAVDGGMVTYPDINQKKEIIENTVGVLHKLGYELPKVGILTAIEKVNPKMPETLEADELYKMGQNGEIKGCVIAGPISLDCAMDSEAAEIKGYNSPVAGDADVLVVPNIHVGNAIGKSITVIARGKMAGFIVGAMVPIILTSRSSSAEEKYLSIALASAI